jgi:putative flippase GtrA
VRKRIINFIEFFHLPLFQFIPAETFRYLFCGVSTLVADWVIHFCALYFIFTNGNINLFGYSVTPVNAAKALAIAAGFVWGFTLNKYVVFTASPLRGRQQLFRYTIIVATCILLNFLIINFLLKYFIKSPTVANISTSLIVAIYSYIVQRTFTFKTKGIKS